MMQTLGFAISDAASVNAIEKVAIEERVPVKTTYEAIHAAASREPRAPAIRWLPAGYPTEADETISYASLLDGMHRAANLFRSSGVGRKDVVSFLLPNLPVTHSVIWGGEAAGIVNPVNPLLEVDHIASILRAAGTRVLVTARGGPFDAFAEKAKAALASCPDVQHVLTIDLVPGSTIEMGDDLMVALEAQDGGGLAFDYDARPDDVACYLHTGGTTGEPKLAQHTHWNQMSQSWVMAAAGEVSADAVMIAGLPLFHSNAYRMTGIMPFSLGAQIALLGPMGYRDPAAIKNFWKTVEAYRATHFLTAPTVYAALLDVPTDGAKTSSLRHAYSGTAPIPVEIIKRFERQFDIPILEGWGLTEGTCASTGNPLHGERKVGSVGLRLPYQDLRVAVMDEDGRYVREAETGEAGVVLVKGPNIIRGYKQEVFNNDLFALPSWLNTGDLGYLDEDEYLWISGRKKDLIIRGGHNIDPILIESELAKHPAIALCAAIGYPDAHTGELPCAFASLVPGGEASEEELLAFCRGTIAERAAVPKRVFIVEQLPLTPLGKISKVHMRADVARWAARDALDAAGVRTDDAEITADASGRKRLTVSVRLASPSAVPAAREALAPFIFDSEVAAA